MDTILNHVNYYNQFRNKHTTFGLNSTSNIFLEYLINGNENLNDNGLTKAISLTNKYILNYARYLETRSSYKITSSHIKDVLDLQTQYFEKFVSDKIDSIYIHPRIKDVIYAYARDDNAPLLLQSASRLIMDKVDLSNIINYSFDGFINYILEYLYTEKTILNECGEREALRERSSLSDVEYIIKSGIWGTNTLKNHYEFKYDQQLYRKLDKLREVYDLKRYVVIHTDISTNKRVARYNIPIEDKISTSNYNDILKYLIEYKNK